MLRGCTCEPKFVIDMLSGVYLCPTCGGADEWSMTQANPAIQKSLIRQQSMVGELASNIVRRDIQPMEQYETHSCGWSQRVGWRFCAGCGQALSGTEYVDTTDGKRVVYVQRNAAECQPHVLGLGEIVDHGYDRVNIKVPGQDEIPDWWKEIIAGSHSFEKIAVTDEHGNYAYTSVIIKASIQEKKNDQSTQLSNRWHSVNDSATNEPSDPNVKAFLGFDIPGGKMVRNEDGSVSIVREGMATNKYVQIVEGGCKCESLINGHDAGCHLAEKQP